ncbi:MAG: DUF4263 domain-containing protein [Deltaproteobacteria bacterium]|nr:DUF4263 domain-containing protein [Deltaproteobacteria bacterium]
MSENNKKIVKNKDFPKRSAAHTLGFAGETFVIYHLPSEWISRQVSYDYGLDLNVEIVKHGIVTGKTFSIQVKALGTAKEGDLIVRIKSTTVNYMKERFEPVLLVVYVYSENDAYWIWSDELPEPIEQKTISVRVPRNRSLLKTDWQKFAEIVEKHYRARPEVDPTTVKYLERFGRYSLDLSKRPLLFKEHVDHFETMIKDPNVKERDLQSFIEQHPSVFIGGEYFKMHAQIRLKTDNGVLIPDFMLEHVSGLCDIMEIKKPSAPITAGITSRRRYSAGVHEAAAQTRVYRDFFDEGSNRKWFEQKYKLKAYKPRTILLLGRDTSFNSLKEKRELEVELHDYRILTYDDLIRIARTQQVI